MFGFNNPQRLLQPWKNLTQFTEELYAMVSSKAPVEREGPVTIKVREGQTALRLVRGSGGGDPPPATARAPRRPAAPPAAPARGDSPTRGREPSRAPQAPPAYDPVRRAAAQAQAPAPVPRRDEPDPVFSVDGPAEFKGADAVRFEKAPKVYDPRRKGYYTPKGFDFPDDLPFHKTYPSAGGTTVFVGKVSSGSGDTYQVALYQSGPGGEPDDTPVEVKIPAIDPDETIDAGTWLFGIFQFQDGNGNTTYSCQPPVWMA